MESVEEGDDANELAETVDKCAKINAENGEDAITQCSEIHSAISTLNDVEKNFLFF